jgi:hypothetical protein
MAEGKTVNLPGFGKTKSVYVWGALALVTVVVGFAYYRHSKNASSAAAATTATAATPLDAEGYPIGSAQDIAYQDSLASGGLGSDIGASETGATSGDLYYDPADGLYDLTSPYTGSGASSGAATNSGPGTFTDNAYWTQYCIENVQGYSATQIQGAIAAVIAGQGLTTTQLTIWQNCVAVGGSPPTAPTSPPHLATQGTGLPPTGAGPGKPAGTPPDVKVTVSGTTAHFTWSAEGGEGGGAATSYNVQVTPKDASPHNVGNRLSYSAGGLKRNTHYEVHVSAQNSAGTGPVGTVAFTSGS